MSGRLDGPYCAGCGLKLVRGEPLLGNERERVRFLLLAGQDYEQQGGADFRGMFPSLDEAKRAAEEIRSNFPSRVSGVVEWADIIDVDAGVWALTGSRAFLRGGAARGDFEWGEPDR